MINTSNYDNCRTNKYKVYSISGDKGKKVNFEGDYYPALAPKLTFWKIWHENIGKISEEENNMYYIQEYWNQVLSKLDPRKIYDELDYSILLCYEDNMEFCHRHIVAAWFEILLNVKIHEIRVNEYTTQELEKPEYIKEYLKKAMRNNRNMKGFNSLRALYLFEKSEQLEERIKELEEKSNIYCNSLRQEVCFLKSEAYMIEDEYNNNKQKKLIKL